MELVQSFAHSVTFSNQFLMLRTQTRTYNTLYSALEFQCTLGILQRLILMPIWDPCVQTEWFQPGNCCQWAFCFAREL